MSPWASLADLAASVRSGQVDSDEHVRRSLRLIEGASELNAFLAVATPEQINSPKEGVLAGVPIAIKDNLATLDLPTSCASKMLAGYTSPFEATAVRKLRDAGAVIVGKTNLDEFAMGSSTENSAFGPTLNPCDPARVPGGSSGGSAAAVAAGLVPGALGSDTGGSVRQPASLCGVVGIKPTYGRVSRFGLVAFASSLDQVGVMARTVADAALLLEVISGVDGVDATSAPGEHPTPGVPPDTGFAGLRVGVPEEYFPPTLDPSVRALCQGAIDRMQNAGAEIVPCSLPNTALAIPTYYVLAPAEAASNLSRFDGVRYGHRADDTGSLGELVRRSRSEGFGVEVKRRIMLGTYALSAGYYDAYYGRAVRARETIRHDFRSVFQHVDVLFTPTSPTVAFKLGERSKDPVRMYSSDVFTVTANLAGLPAASIPIGRSEDLPVGGQFIAPEWREDVLLGAAAALERVLEGDRE